MLCLKKMEDFKKINKSRIRDLHHMYKAQKLPIGAYTM